MKKYLLILFFLIINCINIFPQILIINNVGIDTKRCSFHENGTKREFRNLTDEVIKFNSDVKIFDWVDSIVKQHSYPEEYFKRFYSESHEKYFNRLHNYFKRRALEKNSRCYPYLANPENFWKLPFYYSSTECNDIFPSYYEIEDLYKNDQQIYNDLMYWYSAGFGIPYPIINISVYNPNNDDVRLSHIEYELVYLNQYLPNVEEIPQIVPYIHVLDVGKKSPQRIKIDENIISLIIPSREYITFSILLKSKEGIGHICLIEMALIANLNGIEYNIKDDKLIFQTVLSSKPKGY